MAHIPHLTYFDTKQRNTSFTAMLSIRNALYRELYHRLRIMRSRSLRGLDDAFFETVIKHHYPCLIAQEAWCVLNMMMALPSSLMLPFLVFT